MRKSFTPFAPSSSSLPAHPPRPWLVMILLFLIGALQLLLSITWWQSTPFPLLSDDILNLLYACRPTSVEYGTLYNLGYCGWRQLIPDPLVAFTLKQILMICLLGFVSLRFAQAYHISIVTSCCIALWVTLSLLRVNGTAYAALVVVMLACILAQRMPGRAWLLFCFSISCAFLIRTEYIVALIIGLFFLFLQQYRSSKPRNKELQIKVLIGLACIGGCFALFGLSRSIASRNPNYIPREWLAFGQQFAANMQEMTGMAGSTGMEWTTFVRAAFPSSHSIAQALFENPGMFARHVEINLTQRLLPSLFSLMVPAFPAAFRYLAVLCLLIIAIRGIKELRLSALQDKDLFLIALAFVPTFGVIVIRPNQDYLLPLLPMLIVLIGKGIDSYIRQRQRISSLVLGIALCLLGAGVLMTCIAPASPSNTQHSSVHAVIDALQSNPSQESFSLFASWYADRICALADQSHCTAINFLNHLQPGSPLADSRSPSALFQNLHPKWVLIGPDWATLNALQHDLSMATLIQQPQIYGCSPVLNTVDAYTLLDCNPATR